MRNKYKGQKQHTKHAMPPTGNSLNHGMDHIPEIHVFSQLPCELLRLFFLCVAKYIYYSATAL